MSAADLPAAPRAVEEDLATAERLRRRYPPPRMPRWLTLTLVIALGAVFLGWVIWAALVMANPAVKGQIPKWAIDSDTQVSFTLTVDRPDPSIPVRCRVIAQAPNFERVGSLDLAVPAYPARLTDVTETMRTFRRATSVSVDSCWTE